MQKKIETVRTLMDAMPFIKEFRDEIIVIKYGGSAQSSDELKAKFAQDIVLLHLVGVKVVIVHGGGNRISQLLEDLKIPTEFIDGERVSTPEVMRIVEMVLSGEINKEITSLLNSHGAKAIGISGKDAHFLMAKPKDAVKFGLTGRVESVKAEVIHNLLREGFIPVIAPIGADGTVGHPGYNINADLAASFIAKEIGANKVIFMTDTPGVLDGNKKLLSTLSETQVVALKKEGTIHGGMVPKVDACLEAVDGGVKKAHIIDGRIEHAILLEVFTSDGVGTQITL
ncbi:MAG: acetylglutamate kinase [Sulfuricurvum sp.]|nr:acetylglutamate kinase [Sulfuricurvum sp.]